MVTAGGVGAIGLLMLLGVLTPFYSFADYSSSSFSFETSASLSDNNGQLVVLIGLAALLCIGGCVGEFLRLREGLLVGVGISACFAPSALATLVGLAAGSDAAPHIGFGLWGLAALMGISVVVLLFVGVLAGSDRRRVPLVFPACCLGGGLLLTVGLLIPPPDTSFADHIGSSVVLFAAMNVLYSVVPVLVGVGALVSPTRAMLTLALGVVAWYTTTWTLAATSRSALGYGAFDEPNGAHYVQALALLIFGLAAIGGGLVRWVNGAPQARSTRDYVLPIAACSAFVLMLLSGLLIGA